MNLCDICRMSHPAPECDGQRVKVQTVLPSWVLRFLDCGNLSAAVRDRVVASVRENAS